MSDHLLRALSDMLPNANVCLVSNRPWHSLTFSGTQTFIKLSLSGNDHSVMADKFARELSEQNFDLPGCLVADIAVAEQIEEENRSRLTINALLLDD